MYRVAHKSLLCKQVLLLTLSIWVSLVRGKSFGPSPSEVSPTREPSRSNFPPAKGPGNDPSPGPAFSLSTRTSEKNQDLELPEDEVFPTWALVIICVIAGFIIVSCCLCAVKFYQWKKDQGTYSMWNERELNVESMYARESGVLFEKLDIESSLYEDQCYEIPVDSFITPQRIYIGGTRVTPVKEGLEDSIKSSEQRMSESARRLASVGDSEYCAVTDRVNRGADVISKAESMCGSVNGSVLNGDTSRRSSSSLSTRDSLPERVLSPPTEAPAKESYCKPLPAIVGEPVTCQTYELNTNYKHRLIALVTRPLPQTPPLGPPPLGSSPHVVDSWASLDRSLLKQQKEAELDKKVVFRTLPRPNKLRQLQVPLVNVLTKSASSNDVNKEVRVNDHVACDPHECTLTKIKKRMSQSVDTLLATERISHFYENPDLIPPENSLKEQKQLGGSEGTIGVTGDGHYASVSTSSISEDLPRDKEHLYARISTVFDPMGSNRHSYASVHYPATIPSPVSSSRPKSRHTYISIIFGSTEPVFGTSHDEPVATDAGIPKSHSCSDLSLIRRETTTDPDKPPRRGTPVKNTYVNVNDMGGRGEIFAPTKFSSPRSSTNDHDSSSITDRDITRTDGDITSTDHRRIPKTGEPVSQDDTQDSHFNNNNNLMSFYEDKCPYVNINEALEASLTGTSPSLQQESSTCTDGTPKPDYHHYANYNGDSSYFADNSGSTIEDSTGFSERVSDRPLSWTSGHATESSGLDESYYGVPKVPAIPLERLNEILGRTQASETEGNIEMYRKVNGVKINGLDKSAGNHPKTLSSYLEERYVQTDLKSDGETFESRSETDGASETPIYENYISRNRQSCASEDSLSSGCQDEISVTSSISIEDKETERSPLITKCADADVNGNDVRHVEKLELREENGLPGESLA